MIPFRPLSACQRQAVLNAIAHQEMPIPCIVSQCFAESQNAINILSDLYISFDYVSQKLGSAETDFIRAKEPTTLTSAGLEILVCDYGGCFGTTFPGRHQISKATAKVSPPRVIRCRLPDQAAAKASAGGQQRPHRGADKRVSYYFRVYRVPLNYFIGAVIWFVLPSTSRSATCEDLDLSMISGVGLKAQTVGTESFAPPGGQVIPNRPKFCRISGVLTPAADSNVQFELWMPAANWNGRFLGIGNGGFGGAIDYGGLADSVWRGYAAAATDTGHQGIV